jgi:hypothetical protein
MLLIGGCKSGHDRFYATPRGGRSADTEGASWIDASI